MPQHRITLITIADKAVAQEAIDSWWHNGGDISCDQGKDPWLLYYAQWFDPWLSSYEYYHGLKRYGVGCSRVEEDVTKIQTTGANLELAKRLKQKKWQYLEQKWLYSRIYEGLEAYSSIRIKRKMLLFNRVTGSVLDDDELKKAIRSV